MANRTSATMAIVSRVDNFTARPCLNRTPPERAGKMAPRGETAAHAGSPGDRHQCADHRPRGKATHPRPSPAKARATASPHGVSPSNISRDRIGVLMLARFAAETSSKRLAPLHPREHLPSRMSLDLLKISANGRARLCGAQANSYDGKRT